MNPGRMERAGGMELNSRADGTQESGYYPVYLSLKSRLCLVVGGGSVGERKTRSLLRCGARVRIVAREMTPGLRALCDEDLVTFAGCDYEEAHLDGIDLVFAATSDRRLNLEIGGQARRRRLWCNMATDPGEGSFIVPSVIERGPLSIAISTGGMSPALARLIRERLDREFGPEWALFLRLMGSLRKAIQLKGFESDENQEIFRKIAGLPLLDRIRDDQRTEALHDTMEACRPLLDWNELNQIWDEIWKPFSLSSPRSATPAGPSGT